METLKAMTNKLRIKRYYSIKINNGMGYIASIIDKFMFRFFVFLSLFVYLFIKSNNLLMTILITTAGIVIYFLVAHKINNKKLRENIKIINKKLTVEKIYRKLMNKSTDNYIEYIKEILGNHGVVDMRNTIRKDLDVIGVVKDQRVGIKCYQYSEEHKVDENDMKNFFIESRDNDIKKGIIITTSSFSEDARTFFEHLENIEVSFMTIEDIIEIIKDTSLYPEKKDIEKMILKELDATRLKVRNEGKKIISKDNTKSCIISGIVLILFSKITIYSLYYKIFGVLLIGLGLVPVIKASVNLILSGNIEEDEV